MTRIGPNNGTLLALVATCLVAAVGCVDDRAGTTDDVAHHAAPLIGGQLDLEDEAVVALLFSNGSVFCTGTLVSPSVIITAAHCLDMFGTDPNVTAFFGADANAEGRKVAVGAKKVHPLWNGSVNNPDGVNHDVGMLLLNFPQDPTLPIPLTPEPVTQHIGEPLRRVGFGIFDRDTGELDGNKRVGTTVLHTVPTGPDTFLGGDDMLSTCNGDSGGPSFQTYNGVEYQVGVHSFGFDSPVRCSPPNNGDTRVDLYRDDFIVPWIQANDPACGKDGLCAKIGCIDDPDCVPCGPDGTCTASCPLPDPDCATQGIGDICQADTQCDTGLCVFWEGDPVSKFCSRECTPSANDCPAGMTCRNFATFGNVCYYDEAPDGVLGDKCDQATDCGSYLCEDSQCVITCDLSRAMGCPPEFECSSSNNADYYCRSLATDGGSGGICSTGGKGTGGTTLLILAAFALVMRRRRLR